MSVKRGVLDLLLDLEDERVGVSALGTILILPVVILAAGAPVFFGAPATVQVALAVVPALVAAFAWGGGAGGIVFLGSCVIVVPAAAALPLYDKLGIFVQILVSVALIASAAQSRVALRAAHVYRGLMLRESEEEIHSLAGAAAQADARAAALARRLEAERRLTAAVQRLQGEGGPGEVAERITGLVCEALGRGTIFLVADDGAGEPMPEPLAVAGVGARAVAVEDAASVSRFVRLVRVRNRPVIVRDAIAENSNGSSLPSCRSLIAVILKTGLVGRAVLLAAHPEPDEFGIEDLRLLDHFTIPAGLALANAQYLAETRRLATEDGLTGFLLRGSFDEAFDTELSRARRYAHPLGVFILDLDRFKSLNDEFGHAAGDEALRRVAQTLRAALPLFAKVGRIGGEEFAVLLPGCGPEEVRTAAEGIREKLRATVARPDGRPLTASFGVAGSWSVVAESAAFAGGGAAASAGSPGGESAGEFVTEAASILGRADAALYRAKEAGRDRVVSDEGCLEARTHANDGANDGGMAGS